MCHAGKDTELKKKNLVVLLPAINAAVAVTDTSIP